MDGYTELADQESKFSEQGERAGRANPFRLDRAEAATADQDHDYGAEQQAFNGGKMDLFPNSVGHPDGPRIEWEHIRRATTSGLTMGYFDGNTVTAYWNYAQHFAMSDQQFDVILAHRHRSDQSRFGTDERRGQRSECRRRYGARWPWWF